MTTIAPRRRRPIDRENSYGPIRVLVGVLIALIFSVPIYLVVVNVLKPSSAIFSNPAALPAPPTLENFISVLSRSDGLFWNGLINSTQITVLSVFATIILASNCAYYLARNTGRVTQVIVVLIVVGMMIPGASIIQPIIQILLSAGLIGTIPGLIIVNVAGAMPFAILVFMGFVRSIPIELEQAAAVDGAGPFRIFWQIVFPLMRPAVATVLIFTAVGVWNDFIMPLIVLGPGSGTTVTVGLYRSVSQYTSDYGAVFAFMVLATIPILLLFLFFQRYFVKGLIAGATKG
ncbi:carbohydrate ABC transporter permease [Microbacterium sp. 4R-513]|uniref:carbohydrate ABC transporter permease n=1 Tax=Microbacterium sp. 4R-513 TaxID=2567934 RepID=UPI0019CFC48A|nr:carbohydrate ABC transporter permease [Microbacterium sp. 4R-513]